MTRAEIIIAALVLDCLIGDPSGFPHPVKWIGRFARKLEPRMRRLIPSAFVAGAVTSLAVYAASYFIPWFGIHWLAKDHSLLADLFSILVIYTTIALRSLIDHSRAVFRELSQLRTVQARYRVGMLVGRDTDCLSRREIVRACIESVAENIVDGVTAPLFFAVLFGAPGAMLYRSINTLDSIFGHRDEKYEWFGKLAARIDDVANFIPARLTSPLISVAAFFLSCSPILSFKVLLRDGRKHPSPNAGLSEAAMAGALGVQLGGVNFYDGEKSLKPLLGELVNGLRSSHILKANELLFLTSILTCALYLGAWHFLKRFN